ncbi:MAG TPA: glycerophosphoryl diester phosphodiesterase membrane domain-containing protein [Croceibacterium sp.]|jgi:hypothetical protein
MENRIEVGPLLASVREILSGATKPILAYVAAMTVVFTLMDLYNAESGHFTVSSIGSTVAGYLLMRALVLQTELAAEGEVAGFGSYFGLGLLEGLAYLVGAILLIVPAIVLMIRWTPSIPLLMCEKRGVAQSMDLSWKATKGNFWPLLGLTLLGAVPFVLAVALSVSLFGNGDPTSATGIIVSAITNLCLTATLAYYALLALATYKRLFRPHEGLAEVFA